MVFCLFQLDLDLVGNDNVMTSSRCNKMGLSLNSQKRYDFGQHFLLESQCMWGIPVK